jgi:hypothetical protein
MRRIDELKTIGIPSNVTEFLISSDNTRAIIALKYSIST